MNGALSEIAAAAASVKALADKATEMLSTIEGTTLWKILTGAKP